MRLATIGNGDGNGNGDGGTTAAVIDADGGVIAVDGYRDVGALLAAGAGGLAAARTAAQHGSARPLGEGELLRPILAPGATICVGLNFRSHVLEMGRELPEYPTLFSKLPRALSARPDAATLPSISSDNDYEGELVVVIGRRARAVSSAEAAEAIAGYTLMNDLSVRDYQRRTGQWFSGKSFEASTPVGPWVVTSDELGDPAAHELRLEVNGEERQRASLGDLIFAPAELIAYVSQLFTLQPGDLIATGTPGGVGQALSPPRFLRDGDQVTVSVDAIGTLATTFREAAGPRR
jgi:acylpyruvate hydrolase